MVMLSIRLKGYFLFFFLLICSLAGPLAPVLAAELQGLKTISDAHVLSGILILLAGLGVAVGGWRKQKNINRALTRQTAEAQKSREKYRMMIDNADDGILIVQNFTIKYANPKAHGIMGLETKNLLSANLFEYIFSDDISHVIEHYEQRMLSPDGESKFTTRIVKGDKSAHWVQVRSVSVLFEEEPANLYFIRDISSLKRMEMDLQQAQRMEAIAALSGGIAHDFNNILTTIIGNAELSLMDLTEKDPLHETFRKIQASGNRARDLVQQILTLSRSSSMEKMPLSLSPVVKEALKLLRSTLPSNIRIVETIDTKAGLVNVDATRIYQVFMNLCTNAKQAMEKNGTGVLDVRLARVNLGDGEIENGLNLPAGAYVKLSVIDNGEGIDPEIRDKIFHPYFTTRDPGTGLGLSASLGIIKNYDGDIAWQSEMGQGSEFSIFLPVHEPPQPRDEKIKDLMGRSCQGNILFVDDEKEIAGIVKKIFKTLGYSVVTAGSGKEALEHFLKDPGFFNLVITDMAMPGMTGEQLIREVGRIRPDLPLILCTGHSDTFDRQKALDSGIREYITKPYSLKDLSAMAARYI
ncbi:MAG: response regulator [Proteobacteria bacterium]|nr:response regulator [Pseudomonadota bacterium]